MTTNFPKPLDKQVAAISDSLSQTQDGLAIVADGDTHDAISSGQFVFVRSHSTLTKGMYKATAAIAANGALSTSNLTADGSGGLNDLQSQVTSLNSNITTINSKLSTIGTVEKKTPNSVTIPSASTGAYCDTTLSAGTWIIIRGCNFDPNTNGMRWVGNGGAGRYEKVTALPVSGSETFIQHVEIVELTQATTVKTYVHQTSGSTITIYPYLFAIRIA